MYGFPEFKPQNQGKCVVESPVIPSVASESASSSTSEHVSPPASPSTAVQQAVPTYESLFGLSASSAHTTNTKTPTVDNGNYWNDELFPTGYPSDTDITTITIPTEFPNTNTNRIGQSLFD